MKRAQADATTQHFQCQALVAMRIYVTACGKRRGMAPVLPLRRAAAARTVARMFGGAGRGEKLDGFAFGPPTWAGGSAINAGGAHRIDKCTIGARIPRLHA